MGLHEIRGQGKVLLHRLLSDFPHRCVDVVDPAEIWEVIYPKCIILCKRFRESFSLADGASSHNLF